MDSTGGFILLEKVDLALKETKMNKLVLAGGVSANSEIRRRMNQYAIDNEIEFYTPELKYCGDNAAMVGAQAYYEYKSGNIADSSLNAHATLDICTLK